MSDSEPEHPPPPAMPVVVRDNTGIMLFLILIVFVSMILLSITLVRLGNISRKIDQLRPPPPPNLVGGNRDVTYFYMP